MAATLDPSLNPVVGQDWTGPITQPRCEWIVQLVGSAMTIYYRDVWANGLWRSRIPSVIDALGFTPTGEFSFYSATARQLNLGVLCEVQLVFKSTTGASFGSTPPSTVSENAATLRESITKHPNFSAAPTAGIPSDANSPWSNWWNPATKAFDGNYLAPGVVGPPDPLPPYLIGLTEYEVGTSTITVIDWFDGEPDDVEPLLATITAPAGKDDDGNYLLATGGKNLAGEYWKRSLVYDFASLGWPTQVYPTS